MKQRFLKNIYVLGAFNSIKMDITLYSILTTTLYSILTTYFGVPPSATIQELPRIKASNEIFHPTSYRHVSKRDSTVVYAKVMNGDMTLGQSNVFKSISWKRMNIIWHG